MMKDVVRQTDWILWKQGMDTLLSIQHRGRSLPDQLFCPVLLNLLRRLFMFRIRRLD